MRIPVLFLALLAAACSGGESAPPPAGDAPVEKASPAAPRLEQLWVTKGLSAPEGAAEAPGGGYFISNVAGKTDAKDGEGWISVISSDGAIVTARFADGLNAPKGMATLDGVLYVADIDTVRMIDAATGEAKGDIVVDGAQFLNDVTVWRGAVYVSDSQTATIFRIDGETASPWLTDEKLGGVNGLLGDGDTLFVLTMDSGSLYAAARDGSLSEIATGMVNADGVGIVPGGGWLVSAWPGDIFYVSPRGETVKLLDTRKEGILQNDLSVFDDMVIVPNMAPGAVTAWRIVR